MKRMLNRKDFLKITGTGVAGAALLGLAACGEAGQQQANGNGEVTLSWWDYWTEGATHRAMQERLEQYMEENPNVTIQRRNIPFDDFKPTVTRASGAGDLPDIVVIDNPDFQSFAELGILLDISDRVQEWGEADAYFDGPWQSCQYEGNTYGIPNSSNCLGLFYNVEMLESAGVEPPTNWDELTEAAQSLTTDDHFGLVVSAINSEEGTFQWLPFLWQAGADIPTLDSPGGREALGLWREYVDEGWMARGILNWRQEDVKNEFVNRRAAMMINGPWQIPVIKEEHPDLEWDVVALPEGEESASILGGENMGITTQSENPDAAWELLQWTQEPEGLIDYLVQTDRQPSREDLADEPELTEDDERVEVFIEQLRVARPRAYGPNYPEISSHIQEAMQAAISGQATVAVALSNAQEQITPLLPEDMR